MKNTLLKLLERWSFIFTVHTSLTWTHYLNIFPLFQYTFKNIPSNFQPLTLFVNISVNISFYFSN